MQSGVCDPRRHVQQDSTVLCSHSSLKDGLPVSERAPPLKGFYFYPDIPILLGAEFCAYHTEAKVLPQKMKSEIIID